MDYYSQHGFPQIEAISKIALSRLETPEGYNEIDDIAQAFEAIQDKAYDVLNCINGEAGKVDCNYTVDAERRRSDARIAYEKEF
ncbi:MAG: hypothetical protein H0X02_10100 [Nitrosomonas sp.]|nr:hypothetical protein [Nitrosomonas sp.]